MHFVPMKGSAEFNAISRIVNVFGFIALANWTADGSGQNCVQNRVGEFKRDKSVGQENEVG